MKFYMPKRSKFIFNASLIKIVLLSFDCKFDIEVLGKS